MAFTFPTDTNNKAGAVRQNPGGTGFHVPTVLYDKDGITPVITSQAGSDVIRRIGHITIEPGGSSPKFTFDNDVIIDKIIFTTNGRLSLSIMIEVYEDGAWKQISNILNHRTPLGGSNSLPATPQNIADNPTGEWEILLFDTDHKNYTVRNRDPYILPKGSRIYFNVAEESEISPMVRYKIIGRSV